MVDIPVEIVSEAKTMTRTDWVSFGVPHSMVPTDVSVGALQNKGWLVVVGRELGTHSRMIHVKCEDMGPGERVSDTVVFAPAASQPPAFESHPWFDEINASPQAEIIIKPGPPYAHIRTFHPWLRSGLEYEVVHEDAAERITQARVRFKKNDGTVLPLFWEGRLYQYSGSPVAKWEFRIVCSDSESPELVYKDIKQIRLRMRDKPVVDMSKLLGVVPIPGMLRTPNNGDWWRVIVMKDFDLADGVRPFWSGLSLCLPDLLPGDVYYDQTHPAWKDLNTLNAAQEGGEIVGCCAKGVWGNGNWLGLGHVPELPSGVSDPWAEGVKVHNDFKAFAKVKRSYWDSRPMGMAKRPGQTGAQPNHGITRGGEVVSTGCPLPLIGYPYRITTHLRPMGYYDRDMKRVTTDTHPGWRTWSGRTHPIGNFLDTLGKPNNAFGLVDRPSVHGWEATDEQHYGHLELCTYYALTGRMWAKDLIEELTEVWLAAYHDHAGRGLGRSWLDLTTIYKLTGDARIIANIEKDYRDALEGWETRINGPLKVFPRFTDPRALVDVNGQPVDAAVVWQIGLLAPGLAAFTTISNHAGITEMLRLNVEALISAGWFQNSSGQWLEVDYWAFRDGALTDASYYGENGEVVGLSHRTGWFGDWVAYATLLGQVLLTGSLQDKADSIADQRYSARSSNWVGVQWR